MEFATFKLNSVKTYSCKVDTQKKVKRKKGKIIIKMQMLLYKRKNMDHLLSFIVLIGGCWWLQCCKGRHPGKMLSREGGWGSNPCVLVETSLFCFGFSWRSCCKCVSVVFFRSVISWATWWICSPPASPWRDCSLQVTDRLTASTFYLPSCRAS